MSARLLLLLALVACGKPSQEPAQGDERALERAVSAPQDRARAAGDQVQAAARRKAEAIDDQAGGD